MPAYKSFVPMTGRGAFDCDYMPGNRTLYVGVSVFPDFVDVPSEGVKWTDLAKFGFRQKAQAAVDRVWNDRNPHSLVNRHANPAQRVKVMFGVNFVAKKDASVLLLVPRYASAYGPGNLARCDSYVGLEQITSMDPQAQVKGMVHSESTGAIDVRLTEARNVSRDERRRLEEIVAGLGLGRIAMTPGGSLTPQLVVALANFSARVRLGPPSRPLVPIIVEVRFNQQRDASATDAIRQGRAIRDKLRLFNLMNPVEFRYVNDLSLPDAGHIALGPDLTFETGFDAEMLMEIFAHEYGHMLGLPDEYDAPPRPGSTVAKDVAIQRFLDMADIFHVQKPTMGRMTTSIMCKGTDVLDCHMVTVLEALCKLTRDDHWRVG
jgi:uncharacterized protein YbdZ (MbtH family)